MLPDYQSELMKLLVRVETLARDAEWKLIANDQATVQLDLDGIKEACAIARGNVGL